MGIDGKVWAFVGICGTVWAIVGKYGQCGHSKRATSNWGIGLNVG